MAEDLGMRLLVEVEEVGLDEMLETLRVHGDHANDYFGVSAVDHLLRTVIESRPTSAARSKPRSPVVLELTALTPGGGDTHLLYYATALSVLPRDVGGRQASTVIVDTDGTFSVSRLAQQLRLQTTQTTGTTSSLAPQQIDDTIQAALKHVHIFRPQSLASTVATLRSLPDYLFDSAKHHSFDRPLAFIALDSASAFYWQDRAESERAALAASSRASSNISSKHETGYVKLASALRAVCSTLQCPAIFTSWHLGSAPMQKSHHHESAVRSLRPSLPSPFSQLSTLRFVVQRLPVRKFPADVGVDEAMREAADRQRAVQEGRFEAEVNGWGLQEATLQRLRSAAAGFAFQIQDEGVAMEDEE